MSATGTLARIQSRVLATQGRAGPLYWLLLALAGSTAAVGGWCWSLMIRQGMFTTGLNRPVGWGVLITDFVFWVGIAHSGTLISAILFLFRARFRTAVYRAAEAMTVFAVMTAGLFPIIHLGRPWFFYWLFPYPNQRHLWINFRSPLVWDVFAVSTYFIVSATFLVVGIVPDAAALRDATTGWRRRFYSIFAFGWRGSDEEWRHYSRAYLFFASLATPLVISVHSVVSWDFAMSILPGWHSTIFPPYFVAGAIFSGVAMVITLLIPLRRALRLEELITARHLDMLSRLVLLTSLIVTYSYANEFFFALRGGPGPERDALVYRATGDYWFLFWLMVTCNCVAPLFLFFERVRASTRLLLPICLAVNVGMWLERFNIVVTSLSHDRLPFVWHTYRPSPVEWGITAGSFGWFFFWFLLFVKLLPAVSVAEMKEEAVHEAGHRVADAA
jgi:molybdopterin-containing oxidoreductase family membrane subunit